MLGLAYDAGLRREELCFLSTDDFDPANRLLHIRAETTKGRRARVLPYSVPTGTLLAAHLAHRRTLTRERGRLFVSESRRNHTAPITQFTSSAFTGVLQQAGVRISMNGRGRWMDNVFIERLWRSLKYECIYLHAFETGSELRTGLARWISYYNARRPHSALAGHTPDEAYGASGTERLAA